ncbi:MAG: hypothetical protein H6742_19255 [Alphaproteobacteria bacterium]|nr:hypothetical protein [Alphaproteobacteria bacterium]
MERVEDISLQAVDELSAPEFLVRARAQETLAALSLPGLGGPLASGGVPAGVSGLTPARIAVIGTALAAGVLPVAVVLSLVLPDGGGGYLLGMAVFAAVVGAVALMAIAGGRRAATPVGDAAQCAALQAWLAQHAFVHPAGRGVVRNLAAPRRTLDRAADRLAGGRQSLDTVAAEVAAGLALAEEARDLPVAVPEATLRAVGAQLDSLRDQHEALGREVAEVEASLGDPAATPFQRDLAPLLDRIMAWERAVGTSLRRLTGVR